MEKNLEEKKIPVNTLPKENFMHKIEDKKSNPAVNIVIILLVILAGIGTGYLLGGKKGNSANTIPSETGGVSADKKAIGTADSKTFKDSAEGTLEAGGINGEGTHKLIRPGGVSQTVYLTSSVLDLSKFEGKKVKVWGDTFAGQKAGWLMDVGKVEVLE